MTCTVGIREALKQVSKTKNHGPGAQKLNLVSQSALEHDSKLIKAHCPQRSLRSPKSRLKLQGPVRLWRILNPQPQSPSSPLAPNLESRDGLGTP